MIFLLTRLSRGVTLYMRMYRKKVFISTHTPLARRDLDFLDRDEVGEFLLTRLSRGVTP